MSLRLTFLARVPPPNELTDCFCSVMVVTNRSLRRSWSRTARSSDPARVPASCFPALSRATYANDGIYGTSILSGLFDLGRFVACLFSHQDAIYFVDCGLALKHFAHAGFAHSDHPLANGDLFDDVAALVG